MPAEFSMFVSLLLLLLLFYESFLKSFSELLWTITNIIYLLQLQYKLNLTGITGGLSSGSVRGDDNVAGGMGDSKGTTSSSEGSMWHYGMARRAKGDARRTRVSFLLFWYMYSLEYYLI